MNIPSEGPNNQSDGAKSGLVIVVGRPSAGKSTFINAVCGAKVSIVSTVPQTTRNTIRGIANDPRGQIIFLDTPGFHQADKKMNLQLRNLVIDHIRDADAVLYLIDTTRAPGEEEAEISALVRDAGVPAVAVITKCDARESKPGEVISFLKGRGFLNPLRLSNVHAADSSDENNTGVQEVADMLFDLMPEHPPYYPPEYYTDQDPSFRIAEVLREAAIHHTLQEVPHSIYVEVADLEAEGYDDEGQPLRVWARCFIYVERESQKGIVVGKGGENIKRIRKQSQTALRAIFSYPIDLKLQVKVRPKWRQNDQILTGLLH